MTKQEVINLVKQGGWSAWHTETDGVIYMRRFYPIGEPMYDKLQFSGDCSPKNGWDADYQYAR